MGWRGLAPLFAATALCLSACGGGGSGDGAATSGAGAPFSPSTLSTDIMTGSLMGTAVAPNGDYFILGFRALRKLSAASGALAWEVPTSSGIALALGAHGDPVVASPRNLQKFDAATGSLAWTSPTVTPLALITSIAADAFGNIHVAGIAPPTFVIASDGPITFTPFPLPQGDAWAWKFDAATGKLLWATQLTPPHCCDAIIAVSARVTVDGQGFPVFAVGTSVSRNGIADATMRVLRLDAGSGVPLWDTPILAFQANRSVISVKAHGLAAGASGDVYVSAEASPGMAVLAKLAANGAVAWSVQRSGGPVVLLPGGDLVHGTDGLHAATGILKWQSGAVFDKVTSLAAHENLVLAGGSDNGWQNPRLAAAAFEGRSGRLLWTFNRDGEAADGLDGNTRVAFHPCGAAYVSGELEQPARFEIFTFTLVSEANNCR